jgi:hypothetical protein
MDGLLRYVEAFIPAIEFETAFNQNPYAQNAEAVLSYDRWQRIEIDVTFNPCQENAHNAARGLIWGERQ